MYALVAALPLVPVPLLRGPTQLCPRHKLRFYQGFRCPRPLQLPSRLGDLLLFDYKLLHRGPPNETPQDRPMISAVFSKLFFLNQEAITNRALPHVQTITQKRYWEMSFVHPERPAEYWKV